MANDTLPPATPGFSSDGESTPAISYDTFERTSAPQPTSAVQGKTESRTLPLPEPPAPPAPMVSRARALLEQDRQARALAEREKALDEAEARLNPQFREQRAIRENTREGVTYV